MIGELDTFANRCLFQVSQQERHDIGIYSKLMPLLTFNFEVIAEVEVTERYNVKSKTLI